MAGCVRILPPIPNEPAMNDTPLGFTLPTIHAVRQLAECLRDRAGNDITDDSVRFSQYIANYLSGLALDAAAEHVPERGGGRISTRASPEARRGNLSVLQDLLGRTLTGEDLLERMRTVGTFEEVVAEAIQRDVAIFNPAVFDRNAAKVTPATLPSQ
jgi:hypothetical protein